MPPAAPPTPASEFLSRHGEWLLLLLFTLLYLVPLGYLPLFNPDELRYAEVPREMLASGDFIVPRLNGLAYFEKPPFGYWVHAASLGILGENPFALRLPSALAAGLTALLVFRFGRRLGLARETALGAALVQLTLGEVFFVGTFGVLDSLLTLLLTGGMLFSWLALEGGRRRDAVIAGLFLGAAFLTKGFLAFAVPAMVLVPWALWSGKWRPLFTRGALILLTALLTALPWSVAIHLREPDFWRYFVVVEHLERFLSPAAVHAAPAWWLLAQLPLLAFPWILLAPAAIAGTGRGGGSGLTRDGRRLLWLWLVLPFLFFSLSSGKLATYILPCFPPLSLLVAAGLRNYLEGDRKRLYLAGLGTMSALLGLLLAGLALNGLGLAGPGFFSAGEAWKQWLLGAALAAGIAAGWLAAGSGRARFIAPALMAAPLWMAVHFALPGQVIEKRSPRTLLTGIGQRLGPEAVLVSRASTAAAVAWYAKRSDVLVAYSRGELEYGLSRADGAGRFLDGAAVAALLERTAGRVPVLIFCRKRCGPEFVALFPANAERASIRGFERWILPPSPAS